MLESARRTHHWIRPIFSPRIMAFVVCPSSHRYILWLISWHGHVWIVHSQPRFVYRTAALRFLSFGPSLCLRTVQMCFARSHHSPTKFANVICLSMWRSAAQKKGSISPTLHMLPMWHRSFSSFVWHVCLFVHWMKYTNSSHLSKSNADSAMLWPQQCEDRRHTSNKWDKLGEPKIIIIFHFHFNKRLNALIHLRVKWNKWCHFRTFIRSEQIFSVPIRLRKPFVQHHSAHALTHPHSTAKRNSNLNFRMVGARHTKQGMLNCNKSNTIRERCSHPHP